MRTSYHIAIVALVFFASAILPSHQQTSSSAISQDFFFVVQPGTTTSLGDSLIRYISQVNSMGMHRFAGLTYTNAIASYFGLTSDATQINNGIQAVFAAAANAGTQNRDLALALNNASSTLSNQAMAGRVQNIILFFTQPPATNTQVQQLVQTAISRGINVHTVPVGNNVDLSSLTASGAMTYPTVMPQDIGNVIAAIILASNSLCDKCDIKKGQGYARSPARCDYFTICSVDATGKVLVYTRPCAPGALYDPTIQNCLNPQGVAVPCPMWCTGSNMARFATFACFSYWQCVLGSTTPVYNSCPLNQGFDPVSGNCTTMPNCQNSGTRPACNSANYQVNASKPCGFMVRDNASLPFTDVDCAEGTRFDPNTCSCSIADSNCKRSVATTPSPRAAGQPQLSITFDKAPVESNNVSGVKPYVDSSNDDNYTSGSLPVANGAGVFNAALGNRLRIAYYDNKWWKCPIIVQISFQPTSNNNEDQVLVINGDCDRAPSIKITFNPSTSVVTVTIQSAYVSTTTSTSVAYSQGGQNWKTCMFVFDGATIYGRMYTGKPSQGQLTNRMDIPPVSVPGGSVNAGGCLKTVAYPIQIGFWSGGRGYTGNMDDIFMYEGVDPNTVLV